MSFSKKRFWSAMNLGGLTTREAAERTWTKIGEHEVLTRAAAIAFYAIAALVPFLALVITLSAWFLPLASWILPLEQGGSGPSEDNPLTPLGDLLPSDAASVLGRELTRLQQSPPTGVVSFGVAALLWLSSSLFVSIMDAMNRTMGVQETRPFWKVRLTAMLMTLGQAAILIVVFASTLAWPLILGWLGLSQPAAVIATIIHVATVFLLILISFSVANYFGPDADQRWEWITPGSLLGTLIIMLVSMLFRFYVQNWGNYGASYGSLAGVVVLMSWIWISSVVLLAAAELNKVIEDASPLGKPYGQRHENRA
jgi:membrane protein